MKPITMFYLTSCPHCVRASNWMEEVYAEHPEYKQVEITRIEESEQAELAGTYNYYYVPTYYIDGEKVHEGVASKAIVEDVLRRAYEG